MYLVPAGLTLAATQNSFWPSNNQTGDNAREIPYGQIYARVTTQSNVYTVHMRVQVLQKRLNTPPNQWEEGRDTVWANTAAPRPSSVTSILPIQTCRTLPTRITTPTHSTSFTSSGW